MPPVQESPAAAPGVGAVTTAPSLVSEAPFAIHVFNASNSAGLSLPGCIPAATFCTIKLFAGSPGLMTAPSLPPFSAPANVVKSRPATLPLWQLAHSFSRKAPIVVQSALALATVVGGGCVGRGVGNGVGATGAKTWTFS